MKVLKFIERPRVVLFAGNNEISQEVWEYLIYHKEYIAQTFTEQDKITFDVIKSFNPDVIITCYWPYLLSPEIIKIPKYGCINFHPALLPRNRGWYPAVWEVLEAEEHMAGVTLHFIDKNADTGPILAQTSFSVKEIDTGGVVYNKSQQMMLDLFKEVWEQLYEDGIVLHNQDDSKATYHTKKETNALDEIVLEKVYKAKDLLNLIKAKTFGSKSYAYYWRNRKKYYVRIEVTEA